MPDIDQQTKKNLNTKPNRTVSLRKAELKALTDQVHLIDDFGPEGLGKNCSGKLTKTKLKSASKGSGSPNVGSTEVLSEKEDREEKERAARTLLSERYAKASAKAPVAAIERNLSIIEKVVNDWPSGLPIVAPELYAKRPADENVLNFLRRVYIQNQLLPKNATTAHLELIDKPLADGIRGWMRRNGNLPEDIGISIKKVRRKNFPMGNSP